MARRRRDAAPAEAAGDGDLGDVTVVAFCWDEAVLGASDAQMTYADAARREETEMSTAVARVRQWHDAMLQLLPGATVLSEVEEALDTARQVFKFWNNDIF